MGVYARVYLGDCGMSQADGLRSVAQAAAREAQDFSTS